MSNSITNIKNAPADILRRVEEAISNASARANRSGERVKIIAVTKYLPKEDSFHDRLLACHLVDFGESRPQALVEKSDFFCQFGENPPIRWHLIGSLQRNKIRKILPVVSMIHSIDSVRLLDAVDRIAGEPNLSLLKPVPVLLEVNIARETNKHGFEPDELLDRVEAIFRFDNVSVCGLMGMSRLDSNENEARKQFADLRELRDRIREKFPRQMQFQELSMGMSDDFIQAVEEGATMVRLGSILSEGENRR